MELITNISHSLFTKTSDGVYPIFFSSAYSRFLERQGMQMALIYDAEMEIAMPIKLWKSKVLKYLTCLYVPLHHAKILSLDSEKQFFNRFVDFVKTNKLADRISAPENFAIFQASPSNVVSAPYGSYRVTLFPNNYLEVFSKFQSRYRSAINNSKKSGVEIKYGKVVLNDFYTLHQLTMQRSSMHVHSLTYFQSYLDIMPLNTHLAVAYYENKPVGALLNVYTKYASYYLYGCSSENTFASGAIKYLHSDAMEKMISEEVRVYDFVGARLSDVSGTKLQGIQDFKSRFGSELIKGLLWKCDINKTKCKMADNLLSLKVRIKGNHLPFDIIDQEIKKC
jgi:FemAB family